MALGQNMAKRKSSVKASGGRATKKEKSFQKKKSGAGTKAANVKITKKPSGKSKSNTIKMLLEGELDVNHVTMLREELVAAIGANDHVDISLKNVIQLDLSCIQLLYNVSNAFSGQGRKVTIDAELPAEITDVIGNCGFSGLLFKKQKV